MKYKLPPSLAIVVESDVLGSTAVSVPVVGTNEDERTIAVAVEVKAIEEAVEERENAYLSSHDNDPEDVHIDRELLAQIATKAVVMGDTTWDELAVDCGWTRKDSEFQDERRGDGQKVRSLLGMPSKSSTRKKHLSYDEANALVKAIGVDPVDVGL